MDFWYNFLKVISLLASGLFGALGLLTKYRDDTGKITKWGKVALSGIVLSSSISLILYTLETSRAKAAAERARRDAEAMTQKADNMAQKLENVLKVAETTADTQKESLVKTDDLKKGLTETLGQQKEIAGKMDNSLETQRVVLHGNKEILKGIVEGVERDSQNTRGILQSIWGESNRIEASHIRIAITYKYEGLVKPDKVPPYVLDSDWHLSLRVLRAETQKAKDVRVPYYTWADHPLLTTYDTELIAKEQRFTQRREPILLKASYEQTSYFSGFTGEMGILNEMTQWNDAVIEIHLEGYSSSFEEALNDSFYTQYKYEGPESIVYVYRYGIKSFYPLPVRANLILYIRDRPVVESTAILTAISGIFPGDRLIIAKFQLKRIPRQTFPYFEAKLQK
jgi:hypothetical protein